MPLITSAMLKVKQCFGGVLWSLFQGRDFLVLFFFLNFFFKGKTKEGVALYLDLSYFEVNNERTVVSTL